MKKYFCDHCGKELLVESGDVVGLDVFADHFLSVDLCKKCQVVLFDQICAFCNKDAIEERRRPVYISEVE